MKNGLVDNYDSQGYTISDYIYANLFSAIYIAFYLIVSVGLIFLAIFLKTVLAYVLFGLFVISNLFIVYAFTVEIILNMKKIRKLRRESKMNTNKN